MQDNQHLAELSDEGTSGTSNVEAEHFNGSTVNTPVSNGGARPKVFSSYMRMTKSKSARLGPSNHCSESNEHNPHEDTAPESHCSHLTTSASFLSSHHPFSRDANTLSNPNLARTAECSCEEEPMERWKNAGIALRKALSSTSSCAINAPISNCMSRSFRMSNQGTSNSRGGRKGGSRHYISRKNILDTNSLAISDASLILSNIPVTSSPLLCKTHGSSISESPLTGDLDIASTSQLELRGDFEVATLPLSSSLNRLKRVDSFSKSENEIDISEKRVLERSPGMFNLCPDDHDIRTFDSKNQNRSPHSSQTDLNVSQHHRGLVMNSNRTLENNAVSQVPNCAYADNADGTQSQTYKMLECRLNTLISSDDKSFIEYSSSESDITDCSSLYEDDDTSLTDVKAVHPGADQEERDSKKQKRKSQTSKKYRNGETACSSDSIQEGAKNCQRQKKKMKETLEDTPPSGGFLYLLDIPFHPTEWDPSTFSDSDSETKPISFRRRSRLRLNRMSREKKPKEYYPEEFLIDGRWDIKPPKRQTNRTSRDSAMSVKGSQDWASTDSMSDTLHNKEKAHLGTCSSSSSLDRINGCDLDRTIPPLTLSIVDGLRAESDSHRQGQMSQDILRNLRSNTQDHLVDYNQTRTWSLLDSLYTRSNENLSNLLTTNSGRHRDQQKQDDSDPSCVAYDDVCCSCSASKGGNSCRRSESHNSYHYKDCTNIEEFTWNKLDTQLAWDMWDLPPSESTLIDIPAAVDCHSESETHSGHERDTDSADADDEFECDCVHCQQMRDVFSHRPSPQGTETETAAAAAAAAVTAIAASSSPLSLPTSTASVIGSSGSLSSDHNDWSTSLSEDNPLDINIDELNPLDLLLMRQDARRDMLELMFQNVILQMLAVHPDLLNDQAPPPATQTVIENLQSVHATQHDVDQDSSCPICLCSWELNEAMSQLPCQHLFHPLCIRAWLVKSGTCPVCRHIL